MPVPALRRWIILLAASTLLAAACSSTAWEDPTTTTSTTTTTTSTTITTTPTTTTTEPPPRPPSSLPAPSAALGPTQPIDARDMTLRDLAEVEGPDLDGFVNIVVASEVGDYGSFAFAFPIGWRIWLPGDDPAEYIGVVGEKDPAFSRVLMSMLEESNSALEEGESTVGLVRAAFVDSRPEFLAHVLVYFTPSRNDSLESLRQLVQDSYPQAGADVLRSDIYPVEGGGAVERSALVPQHSEREQRVQHQRLVLDEANSWIWSIVADIHLSGNDLSSDECWTLLRSVKPFGHLTGP